MHATKNNGFRYGVRGPGRRSNTCTKLIVGGVAVLCLVVLVLVVAVAVGVALSIKGSLKHDTNCVICYLVGFSYRLRFYSGVFVRECSQKHGHFGRPLRRLLPVQLRWMECSQPCLCWSHYSIRRSCSAEYEIAAQCNREWQRW